ncbi:MAG TPA: hypothetical protein VM263_02525, partial [Acidimicrobiales bacterium]|nr:hypothetical protein [Acidimicrobiales bacterium]
MHPSLPLRTVAPAGGRRTLIAIALALETEVGRTGTAAVVHLLRFGPGPDAPWEVVGTENSFSASPRPAYGARVTSPLAVGGRITGVDESIRVQVRQVSSDRPIGELCCLPAGGEGSPWQASVSFQGARRRHDHRGVDGGAPEAGGAVHDHGRPDLKSPGQTVHDGAYLIDRPPRPAGGPRPALVVNDEGTVLELTDVRAADAAVA